MDQRSAAVVARPISSCTTQVVSSHLFWSAAPERPSPRAVDPLGFDALREAMADHLVPLLSSATRSADDYLWTLIGLRWAHEHTKSSIDATLFTEGFARYERLLKQFWVYYHRRPAAGISGITVISDLCEGDHPNDRRPILANQRTAGLLGNYIVSLRGMGLVRPRSLRLHDAPVDSLLVDLPFHPPRSWTSSWSGLRAAFTGLSLTQARVRLGRRLFDRSQHSMHRAATAVRSAPGATSWAQVRLSMLDRDQARLARATRAVMAFEVTAQEAFAPLLQGASTVPQSLGNALRADAAAMRRSDPYPTSWSIRNPLRRAMDAAISALEAHRAPGAVLLDLHKTVTMRVRRTESWIRDLGEPAPGFRGWTPRAGVPDFRFHNLCELVRTTRWRPHAV